VETFAAFLTKRAHLPEAVVFRYERWAQSYEAWRKTTRAGGSGEHQETAPFFSALRQKAADWEVAQARRAVRFYTLYKQQCQRPPPPDPPRPASSRRAEQPASAPVAVVAAGRDLMAEMQRAIRLKHLSYRTENSCLGWASRFLAFVGWRREPHRVSSMRRVGSFGLATGAEPRPISISDNMPGVGTAAVQPRRPATRTTQRPPTPFPEARRPPHTPPHAAHHRPRAPLRATRRSPCPRRT
jgi:hypothetical protein